MLLALGLHIYVSAILFAAIATVLVLVILLQRGRGVGLAGAFGGTGGQSAFGAKTGDFLTWVTVGMAGLLLFGAVILNYIFRPPAPPPPRPRTVGPAPHAQFQPIPFGFTA